MFYYWCILYKNYKRHGQAFHMLKEGKSNKKKTALPSLTVHKNGKIIKKRVTFPWFTIKYGIEIKDLTPHRSDKMAMKEKIGLAWAEICLNFKVIFIYAPLVIS